MLLFERDAIGYEEAILSFLGFASLRIDGRRMPWPSFFCEQNSFYPYFENDPRTLEQIRAIAHHRAAPDENYIYHMLKINSDGISYWENISKNGVDACALEIQNVYRKIDETTKLWFEFHNAKEKFSFKYYAHKLLRLLDEEPLWLPLAVRSKLTV